MNSVSGVIGEEVLEAMHAKLRALVYGADLIAASNPDSHIARHLRATLALALDQMRILQGDARRERGQHAMQGLQRTLEPEPEPADLEEAP